MDEQTYRIGIDLGGAKTETIVLDPGGREMLRWRIPTPRPGGAGEYDAIVDNVSALITDTIQKIPSGHSCTIGIGGPGSMDPETGLVRNSNTISLNHRPLKADIEKRIGRRVEIKNDANCFALAESLRGAGRGFRIVFGIIMGSGCGGGIFWEDQIYEGRHGLGGEWGHVSIDPQGAPCYCGNRGCIETCISGPGVEAAHARRFGRVLSMKEIVQGFREGHVECTESFNRFLDDFGRAVGGLISILDPEAIVIGGGLSNIDELYGRGAELVRRYAFHPRVDTPVLKNELGDSAGVFGAAMIGR